MATSWGLLGWEFSRGGWNPVQLVLALLIPAAASLMMLLLGRLTPVLYGSRGLRAPLNVTLPVVHASLMFLVVAMAMTGQSALKRPPDGAEAAFSWFHPGNLAMSALAQMVVLSLLVAARWGRARD